MKVILISGKAQNGKDTVADILQSSLANDSKRVLITHYADLLKFICKNYLGWDGKKDEKGRQMLQYVGTDVIRAEDPTFWVDFVAKILQYFHTNWDYVIIPDCRFPNEVTVMSEVFETIHLRVTRNSYKSPLTEEQLSHMSETSLDNVEPDYHIPNDGTIEDLKNIIIKWIKEKLYENKA